MLGYLAKVVSIAAVIPAPIEEFLQLSNAGFVEELYLVYSKLPDEATTIPVGDKVTIS